MSLLANIRPNKLVAFRWLPGDDSGDEGGEGALDDSILIVLEDSSPGDAEVEVTGGSISDDHCPAVSVMAAKSKIVPQGFAATEDFEV